jgi:hypothetical protein
MIRFARLVGRHYEICRGYMPSRWVALRSAIRLARSAPRRAWTVDRDGRIRTEKDRPVELRAKWPARS